MAPPLGAQDPEHHRGPVITGSMEVFPSLSSMFGVALFLLESKRSVREFQLTLVFSSLSLMATGIYRFLAIGLTAGRLMSAGQLGDPNDTGALIVMALPFALVSAVRPEKAGPFAKVAGVLYAVLAAIVIWLTRSRGTMLAMVAQILVFRLLRSSKPQPARLPPDGEPARRGLHRAHAAWCPGTQDEMSAFRGQPPHVLEVSREHGRAQSASWASASASSPSATCRTPSERSTSAETGRPTPAGSSRSASPASSDYSYWPRFSSRWRASLGRTARSCRGSCTR